ncbi:MAG: hypothetical protein VYE77_06535 [Planctomycetota bacterium]|nr:hypothetical protein [Planctomycetota bacterium]
MVGVLGAFGKHMKSHTGSVVALSLLLVCSLPGALPAQDAEFNEEQAQQRYRWIIKGSYQRGRNGIPEPDVHDVALARLGLSSANNIVCGYACLALESLAREELMKTVSPKARQEIADQLADRLDDEHEETADFASRAIGSLCEHGHLDPQIARKSISAGLGLLLSEDRRDRKRGAHLLRDLDNVLGDSGQISFARTLFLALERYPGTDDQEGRVTRQILRRCLGNTRPVDAKLSREIAGLLLAELAEPTRFGPFFQRGQCLVSLGRHFNSLQDESRDAAFARLSEGLLDRDLVYMLTSGVRSPLLHWSCQGLVLAAPSLTAEQVEQALAMLAKARERAPGWGAREAEGDLASLFGPLQKALTERQAQIR